MTMVLRIILLLITVLGAVMIAVSRKRVNSVPPGEGFEEAVRGCSRCDAVVLDVHSERDGCGKKGHSRNSHRVIILQIRFEEQKRTVVHKCTETFFGKYYRGQHIPVYSREGVPVDFCMLADDNRFIHRDNREAFRRRALLIFGTILIAAGVMGQLIIGT